MSENRTIGVIVAAVCGVALIVIAGIVLSKNSKAAAREKEIAAVATKLAESILQSNKYVRDRDFERAISTLQAVEPSIVTIADSSLKGRYDQVMESVRDAERDYKEKVKNGWTVIEGNFISPKEKQQVLADRKRKQEEELRQAEQERRLAEARQQAEAAERQRREEERKAEEQRKAEEERKAMEPTSITWAEYVKDCGVKAQQANEARTEEVFQQKYEDKRIRWSGRVVNVDTALLSNDFSIMVRMNPTESLYSDLILTIPETFKAVVMSLNKGDSIEFVGTIRLQGGPLSSHNIHGEQISKK